jgi:hypothetical protein
MKKPDLLILIAIWEFITAFFAFIGIVTAVFFTFFVDTWGDWGYYYGTAWNNGDMPRAGFIICMSVGILILLCYMVLAILSGIGLLTGKGWGRITGIVHSALSIFSVPIGTVIGILSIIYLVKPEVQEYFAPKSKV